jgi:hypothetical protein
VPGPQSTPLCAAVPAGQSRDRRDIVRLVYAATTNRASGQGVEATALAEGVPVSSMYHYLARSVVVDAPAAEQAFFNDPAGLDLLHRLVTGAHLVFGQVGGCGSDRVCQYLQLTRLDRYAAASHGYHRGLSGNMERLLGEYGDEQRAKLAPGMTPKRIALAEDETFHSSGMCLVAVEVASDMILLETYSQKRDGATWTERVDEALDGLAVTVAEVVADEAKGLIAHAHHGLGCHFSPDLFHPQHDLSKATALPLAARLEAPREALAAAEARTGRWREHQAAYEQGPRGPGRPMDYERRIAEARAAEDLARAAYGQVVQDQASVRAANRSLSDAYHPFDLSTGAAQSPQTVHARFQAAFATIDEVVHRAGLSDRCRKKINKARALVPKLVATVAFFHGELERTLAELDLAPAVLEVVRFQLVPGLYLARAARKARSATERAAIRAVSDTLLAQARSASSPVMALDHASRQRIEFAIVACLDLFVRSSACVEGRNGYLALLHHGLHHLSKRRLKALTVLHNYYARRPDGTTAAERFFGQTPDDLFDWLLARLDVPAQPRAKRLRLAA